MYGTHMRVVYHFCSQCAARVPRRGTQLHLATFANFSQREQWKFKQWCKWINCNFVVFELFEIFFSHKLLVFVRGEQPEVSQVCADVPCQGCWCTASSTQHCNQSPNALLRLEKSCKFSMCWLGPSPSQVSIQYFSQSIFFHNVSNSLENTNTINNFISLIVG